MPFYIAGKTARLINDGMENASKGRNQDEEETSQKKRGNVVSRFIGAVGVGISTTAAALTQRDSVQASIDSVKMRLSKGQAEIHDNQKAVKKNAKAVLSLFKEKKFKPRRLAIDGVPGSGKSSLAYGLAEKLDFQVKTLDYIDMNKPQDFSKMNTIYEHHRLLRTQLTEIFDAIIYIDEPVELSKKKCVHRKRGGINIDVFDYDKLKKIGEKAFEAADGKTHEIPGTHIKIKFRPKKGFNAYKNLRDELKKKGIKTERRSKEELLFLSVYEKAESRLMAYINFGAYNKELKKGIKAGISTFFMS